MAYVCTFFRLQGRIHELEQREGDQLALQQRFKSLNQRYVTCRPSILIGRLAQRGNIPRTPSNLSIRRRKRPKARARKRVIKRVRKVVRTRILQMIRETALPLAVLLVPWQLR